MSSTSWAPSQAPSPATSETFLQPVGRWHVARTLAGRELASYLRSLSPYVVLALVLLAISYISIRNILWQVDQNGLMVLDDPIGFPFFLAIALASVYLGLHAAMGISREKESGTLEVLFYGPVDPASYLAGKYLQHIGAFSVLMAILLAYFASVGALTNLGYTPQWLQMTVLAFFLASTLVGFGLLLSTLTRRVMVSVLVYLGLILFFFGFSVTHALLLSLPGDRLTTTLTYARLVADNLNAVVQWISPLSYFSRGSTALVIGRAGDFVVSLAASAAYTAVLLALAVVALSRKGVRR